MNSVHASDKLFILISTQLDFFSQENCSSVFLSENSEYCLLCRTNKTPHVPIHNIHEFTIKTRLFIPYIFKKNGEVVEAV